MTPLLKGVAGPSLISILGEDHRILTFGGASVMYPLMDLMGLPQSKSEDDFEFRVLEFRASKANNATVNGVEAISSSSACSNETHVMLFGGYLGNSRTAAVHTWLLAAPSPDLALSKMLIKATGPSARSFPGVIKPDDSTLLMFGGIVLEQESGATKRTALGDLWDFDLNTQSWTKVHDTNQANLPRGFGAFGSMNVDGETILFTYGGLQV